MNSNFSVRCLEVSVKFTDRLAHTGVKINLRDGDSRTTHLEAVTDGGLLTIYFIGKDSEIFNSIAFNLDKVLSFETSGPFA